MEWPTLRCRIAESCATIAPGPVDVAGPSDLYHPRQTGRPLRCATSARSIMPNHDMSGHYIFNPDTTTTKAQHYEDLLEQLIELLPGQKVRNAPRWLRQASSR